VVEFLKFCGISGSAPFYPNRLMADGSVAAGADCNDRNMDNYKDMEQKRNRLDNAVAGNFVVDKPVEVAVYIAEEPTVHKRAVENVVAPQGYRIFLLCAWVRQPPALHF